MMKVAVTGMLAALVVALATSALATDYGSARCKSCVAPRPHYDSREVVHTPRDVDHSRVINTQTVVPVSRKVRTTNHLVIRKNTVRHVGVVRHKHTIIEKEIRYTRRVRAAPVVINFVVQEYRTVRRPAMVYVPVQYYPRKPLRVRG